MKLKTEFKMKKLLKKDCESVADYVEDFLKDKDVFYNLYSDTKRDPGSYGSAVNYRNWDACKNELFEQFGARLLKSAAEQFENWTYLSSTFHDIAFCINQLLESKKPQSLNPLRGI